MPDIGWISITNADDYFETRYAHADWDTLNNEDKKALLTTSYDRIRYYKKFNIPPVPTAAQKAKLADAQCEMANYIIIHLADEDRRKGLQAQGVVGAGIVKETYEREMLLTLPIPPIVLNILDEFLVDDAHFGIVDLARDEEESVDTKVHDF